MLHLRPHSSMRALLLLLVVGLVLVGCQRGQKKALQQKIDSLETANEQLQQRLNESTARSTSPSSTADDETTLTPSVYFPSGSAWLFNDAKKKLDKHAELLKNKYADADFRIKGYTDSVPIGPSLKDTYPSNWYLSAQRAAAVAHYLDKEHGVRTETLEIEAFGPKKPIAPNETPTGRRKNRRVEIVVEDGS